jgi:hypothetical protein
MRRRWALGAAALGVVGAAGGIAGYAIRDHRPTVTVLTGTFYAGDRQAEATVDGWSYGLSDGVTWQDAQGSWHDRGWPDCLGPVGSTHTLRFGYVPVTGLAEAWRQVVWVSCMSA